MSDEAVTIVPLGSYRTGSPYPFCPGCGHGGILDQLNKALLDLKLDPRRIVIVSDIGCSGLSDQYFATNAFHGLHGRSVAYASGIKLVRPDLTVITIMGDGGCGIGGTHLLSAARRNVGITLLVFNNLNFGMTGGQHSVTTPLGARTATTPAGNLERPLDVCATLAANGAGYVYRGTVWDKDLSDRIAEAIAFEGFSVLDVWELCTAYYVPSNAFSRSALVETLERLRFPTGLVHREERPEYARAYREAARTAKLPPAGVGLEPRFPASLDRPFRLVVAGSAGGRIRSAARLACVAGVLSGLRATQRDDYPVTVQTGHSVSEIVLSPTEVGYSGIARPDAMVVATTDGLGKVRGYLAAMTGEDRVFLAPEVAEAPTRARKTVAHFPSVSRGGRALALLAAALGQLGLFPIEALEEAARVDMPAFAEENLKAIAAGRAGPALSP